MNQKLLYWIIAVAALFLVLLAWWGLGMMDEERQQEQIQEVPIETPEQRLKRELTAPPKYSPPGQQQIQEDLAAPSGHAILKEDRERIQKELLAPPKY